MNVTVAPSTVQGQASPPPSKSYTHRALLAGGYGETAVIENPLWSADTEATARAVEALGGVVRTDAGDAVVSGFDGRPAVPDDVINCENSGTTIRLLSAAAALADGITVLTGDASLRSRPQGPLLDAISQLGGDAASTRSNGQAPVVITGPIDGGSVAIPGDVSSQYITALVMAGAVTDDGIDIELTTELKSAPYVDITLEVLDDFGVEARETSAGYSVPGGQTYAPDQGSYTVPGDFSSLSYLIGMGVLAAPDGLTITGAKPSAQGDTAIVDIISDMGGDLTWDRNAGIITTEQSSLTGTTVGVADTPDLLPTIAAVAAVADGTTHITNCEHVRYKETDRVSAMATELRKLGANVGEQEDELIVHGGESTLTGATVEGHDDHRIIMALSLAGLVADGETTITGAEHVDVSFPSYFDLLYDLGADVTKSNHDPIEQES